MSTRSQQFVPSARPETPSVSVVPSPVAPLPGPTGQRLTDTELAWVAGFIDGEGCFSIKVSKSWVRGCCVRIQLTNTHLPTLCLLRRFFGGRVAMHMKAGPTWRTTFSWEVNGDRADHVAEQILPYLQEKREQAELFREFHSYKGAGKTDRRVEIVAEMKRLKRPFFAPDAPRVNKPGERI